MTFIDKKIDSTKPIHWRGNMQADYLYTSGIAGDKLFKHIMKNDSFLATECSKCNKVFFPPRFFCENCLDEIKENKWIEVPASGIIKYYTIVTIDTYGEKLEKPKLIGLINIEKTDSLFLGIIKTNDFNKDFKGVKVQAIFKSKEKRDGTLKDILYFIEKL